MVWVDPILFYIDSLRWEEYNVVMIFSILANPGKPGGAKLQNL